MQHANVATAVLHLTIESTKFPSKMKNFVLLLFTCFAPNGTCFGNTTFSKIEAQTNGNISIKMALYSNKKPFTINLYYNKRTFEPFTKLQVAKNPLVKFKNNLSNTKKRVDSKSNSSNVFNIIDDKKWISPSYQEDSAGDSTGYLRPEWFGANPNDEKDDSYSIQLAMNTAKNTGLEIRFSEGVYLIGSPLRPKKVGNGAEFKLALIGKGQGITVIKGMKSLKGKNILELIVPEVKPRMPTYTIIRDIEFLGNGADRIIYANNISNLDIQDCAFMGGDTCGVQIGDKLSENYSIYINRCYFNGVASHGGHNQANLRMYARYAVIKQMVCDGSQYGIDLFGDRAFIESCLFEGNKKVGINIRSTAGGSHKIIGNDFLLYGGFEPSAIYDGTLSGICIESIKGGSSNIIISNNWMYIPDVKDRVIQVNSVIGSFTPSPTSMPLEGTESKAKGRLLGYDKSRRKMVIEEVSGSFLNGEQIIQPSTNGTAKFSSSSQNKAYGIQLLGIDGSNIISSNQIRGATTVAIYIKSQGNIIEGNYIESKNGLLIQNDSRVYNNSFNCPQGYAMNNNSSNSTFIGNSGIGEMVNIEEPYLRSGIGKLKVIRLTDKKQVIIQSDEKTKFIDALFQVHGKTYLDGGVQIEGLLMFKNNASARKSGLKKGMLYCTKSGEVRICY